MCFRTETYTLWFPCHIWAKKAQQWLSGVSTEDHERMCLSLRTTPHLDYGGQYPKHYTKLTGLCMKTVNHTVYTLHLDIETFSGQGLGNQTAFKPWLLVILVRTTRDLIFLSFIFLICKNRANECIGCWGKENKIMYPIVCYNAKNSINGSYYCLHFSLKSKGIVWGRDF